LYDLHPLDDFPFDPDSDSDDESLQDVDDKSFNADGSPAVNLNLRGNQKSAAASVGFGVSPAAAVLARFSSLQIAPDALTTAALSEMIDAIETFMASDGLSKKVWLILLLLMLLLLQ
jgi:hypothetical protein